MFENLRDAFREAVDNFKEEIRREDVPEAVDTLLRGMKAEVTDKKAYVRGLEVDLEQTLAKVDRERSNTETALRRQKLAQEIGDTETAQVAGDYSEKHARSLMVLEQKAKALEEELQVRRAEVTDMMAQLKSAIADREGLVAQAGRSQTRRSLSEADDLFAQMDRMAEKIEGTDHEAKAAEELAEDLGTGQRFDDIESEFSRLEREPERSVEDRLEELKRRMGEDQD